MLYLFIHAPTMRKPVGVFATCSYYSEEYIVCMIEKRINLKKTQIFIHPDDLAELKSYAIKKRVTVSFIVRELIFKFLVSIKN